MRTSEPIPAVRGREYDWNASASTGLRLRLHLAASTLPSGQRPRIASSVRKYERGTVLPAIEQHEQEQVEAEPALAQAARDVEQAKGDIRALVTDDANRIWTLREIQERIDTWRGTVVSLALMDMERNGEVEVRNDLSVRVLTLRSS